MKKTLMLFVAIIAFAFAANAQNGPNLGIRFGAGDGTNAELSLQLPAAGNRVELDLGYQSGNHWNYTHLSGVYQWVFNLTDGLNLFAGVGANLGFFNHDLNDETKFGLGVAGQFGIEYDFDFPLQLALDVRPNYTIVGRDEDNFNWGGVAFSIRYRFGK